MREQRQLRHDLIVFWDSLVSARRVGPQFCCLQVSIFDVNAEDALSDFEAFYANDSHFYIRRSLTLLPDESIRLWDYLNTLYMPDPRVFELDGLERGINRAQIEFLAARASAVLGCYY